MTTSRPASARRPAHTSPAGPAPMTTTSQLRWLMARSQSRCDLRYKAMASCADAPPCRRARSRCRRARRGLWLGLERRERRHEHQRDGEHQRRHGQLEPGRGPRGGRTRRAPGQGRRLRQPALRHRASGRPAADLRRRAGGGDRRRARRQARRQAVPRHPLEGHGGGEQGLLSMAFAPDYAQSGLFYVYYTEKSGTEPSGSTTAPAPTAPTRAARASCCAWRTPSPTTTAA